MKRATIRTTHANADRMAAALRPDNTDQMETVVTDDTVETTIERSAVGGLQTTVDDYLINLQVATTVDANVQTNTNTTHDYNENDNE